VNCRASAGGAAPGAVPAVGVRVQGKRENRLKKIYAGTGNKAFPALFLCVVPSRGFLTGDAGGVTPTCLLAGAFRLVPESQFPLCQANLQKCVVQAGSGVTPAAGTWDTRGREPASSSKANSTVKAQHTRGQNSEDKCRFRWLHQSTHFYYYLAGNTFFSIYNTWQLSVKDPFPRDLA